MAIQSFMQLVTLNLQAELMLTIMQLLMLTMLLCVTIWFGLRAMPRFMPMHRLLQRGLELRPIISFRQKVLHLLRLMIMQNNSAFIAVLKAGAILNLTAMFAWKETASLYQKAILKPMVFLKTVRAITAKPVLILKVLYIVVEM